MTPRERHIPDGGTAAAAPSSLHAATAAACLWEDLYQRAAPAQQEALLALAARQGVLYAHQIAPPENGTARRPLLPALLNGQIKDLQAFRSPCLEPSDVALDDVQREAVARALHTPDICLIQGLPGTGKSRVVAEIICQAATRGERVLFLGPGTAALDRVLQEVGALEDVFAVRCLAPQEKLQNLPPCIRRLTLAERVRYFEEQTIPAAKHAVETARQSRDALRHQEPIWQRLGELVAAQQRTLESREALNTRRQAIAVDTETGPVVLALIAAVEQSKLEKLDKLRPRRADAQTALAKGTGALQELDEQLAQLTPLAEARRAGRWWCRSWWQAIGKGDVVARFEDLRKRRDDLQATCERLTEEQTQLDRECAAIEACCRADCVRIREAEMARQLAELETQLAELQQEQQRLDEEWHVVGQSLPADVLPQPIPAALHSARAAWTAALREAEEEMARSQQWAEGVESAKESLPQRIAHGANVVAGLTHALAADPHFGDKAAGQPLFDLLILEDADQVTESEFVHSARRARRWVLVGEPMADAEASDALPRRAAPGRPLRPAALRPGFFQRLWQHLHPDPRRLPYAWSKRDGRLVCRMRPLPVDQQTYVESEWVADRPEIELRIVSPPRQLPHLVEVVFPGDTSIYEAKEYLFRELGEAALQAHTAAGRWTEEPDRFVLHLETHPDPDAVPVYLGQGIRELVGTTPAADCDEEASCPWQTCGLVFDRSAGWSLERAQHWVETELKQRDLGRTAFLGTSYRMQPALAQVLSNLLSIDDVAAGQPPFCFPSPRPVPRGGACLEFVAVPTQPMESEPRRRSDEESHWQGGGTATVAARVRSTRGGAGLEVDLADPRRLDPLPVELRAGLPNQGIVNYLEAQALVRRLEILALDPTVLAAAASIHCPQQGVCHGAAHCPVIAVMALYDSQVQLIQQLIERSAALASCPVAIEVGLPAAFQHRGCHVALISLTRSHTHRAVTYGDHPRALVQALTRARSHVVVFGDPGTLARRSQWQGPVDHLDQTAAAQERHLAEQLLHYIQGQGSFPHAFPFREGSSV